MKRSGVLLVMFLLALADCTGSPGRSGAPTASWASSQSPSPGPYTPSPFRSSRQPQASNGGPQGLRLVAALPGPVGPLIHTKQAIYAAYPSLYPVSSRGLGRIARFELGTGAVVKSPPFHGGHDLAIAGGSLWASGTPPQSGTFRQEGEPFLYRFDPRTLAIEDRVELPEVLGPLASSPAGLWVGAPRHLYLLDPTDGRIRTSVAVQGVVSEIAVNSTGRFLYVSARHGGSTDGFPIQERDAHSGAIRVIAPQPPVQYANWLSPTRQGVWMSAATGNFGAAFFLRRTDLQGDRHPVEAGQRVEGSVAAGHLWLQNGVGAALVCANPTTGRVQGEVSATQSLGPRFNGLSNVVAAGGFVFVGTGGGLLRIEPGLCRSSSATPTQGASPAPTTSELTVSLPEPVAQTFAAGSDWVIDDDGLVRLDRSGKVIARVPGLRGDIAGDDAGVWVIAQDGTLSRFDPATNQVAAISVPVKDASYIAIGAGGVWIAGGPNLQFPGGPGGRQLVEVDPSTDKVALHTTVLCPSSAPCTLTSLAADATAVWVGINPFDSDSDVVAKIDPASGNVTATTSSGGRLGVALATGEGALWAAGEGLDRIDPQTGKVTSHIECCLFPPDQGTVAVGAGYVWVVDFGGLVTQVDPTTNRVVNTFIPFPNLYGIGSPAPTQDGVWIIGPGEVVLVRP